MQTVCAVGKTLKTLKTLMTLETLLSCPQNLIEFPSEIRRNH